MDKSAGMVIAVSAIILGIIVGVFGFLRYDLGDMTFYIIVSFASGSIFTMILVGLASVGFRLAQRSDNVDVAMAGMGKMMLGFMETTNRQQNQQFRQLIGEMKQPAITASNPWGDEDDLPTFGIPPTVEYSHNGTGASNGHR